MKREFMNVKPEPPMREEFDWETFFRGAFYFSIMSVWLAAVFAVICVLASLARAAPPDDVAVDFAVATMIESKGPSPEPSPYDCPACKDTGWIMHGDGHQTKCPNCDLAGAPFSIIRQAKELIRKGNLLADRGKALLDAVQKEGKLTVDIRLPQIATDCPDGSCPVTAPLGHPEIQEGAPYLRPAEAGCSNGRCPTATSRPRVNSRMKIFKGWRR